MDAKLFVFARTWFKSQCYW